MKIRCNSSKMLIPFLSIFTFLSLSTATAMLLQVQRLIEAAAEGQNAVVRQLLDQKVVDVNAVGKQRAHSFVLETALHAAARKNRWLTAQILRAHGAATHVCDSNGQTPLHIAVLLRHKEVLAVMAADNGHDVDGRNRDGYTSFHIAVINGRHREALILMRNGADVNVRSHIGGDFGRTPLHWAARSGRARMTNLVLSVGGADVNIVDQRRYTPLQELLMEGLDAFSTFRRVITCLLRHGASTQPDTAARMLTRTFDFPLREIFTGFCDFKTFADVAMFHYLARKRREIKNRPRRKRIRDLLKYYADVDLYPFYRLLEIYYPLHCSKFPPPFDVEADMRYYQAVFRYRRDYYRRIILFALVEGTYFQTVVYENVLWDIFSKRGNLMQAADIVAFFATRIEDKIAANEQSGDFMLTIVENLNRKTLMKTLTAVDPLFMESPR